MPDRTQQPPLQPNRKTTLPPLSSAKLDNGIPVQLLQIGRQPLLELALIFPAGKSFEPVTGISGMITRIFPEGTRKHSSLEFARRLDQYGASIDVDSGFESVTANLTTLSKHLKHTIPLLAEMLLEPLFDTEEFRRIVARTVSYLEVEEQKTEYIARREFSRLLFGDMHPYGKPTGREEIAALRYEDLAPYYQKYFPLQNATLLAVGRFDSEELMDVLNAAFGHIPLSPDAGRVSLTDSAASGSTGPAMKGFHFFEKPEAQQATIRAGHMGFRRDHPDFYSMEVTNMLFGGYFSSRLNKIIREEKGYTYGIHSGWVSLRYAGYLVVQSDVGNAYVKPTFDQIKAEMKRLQDHGTTEDELRLVKNFMLGRLLSSRETPSQLLDTLIALFVNGLPYSELDEKFDRIEAVTPEIVQEMAQKWFRPDELLEVASGHEEKEA